MINEKLAKKYCKEDISKIKNYDLAIADKTKTWVCHHMTEIWWNCTMKELIDNECYYNRKACELIFLTPAEHKRLHNEGENHPFFGKHHSEETKKKMSEAHKGLTSPRKGVTLSEETKKKMSEAKKCEKNPFYGKTHSEETRKKISEAKKGRTSNRKGVTLSEETRKKISEAAKRRFAAKNNLKTNNT